MTNTRQTDTTAWYRQFWPWFIFGLPAVVVVASLITVYIAVKNPDPVVDGDYYKHGLTINEQLDNAEPTPAAPAKAPE